MIMDDGSIHRIISSRIDRAVTTHHAKFLVFTKQNDAVSDCLANFVRSNELDATIIDIDAMSMLELSDDYSLSPVDVPCICLAKTCEILYRGCPTNTEWAGGL